MQNEIERLVEENENLKKRLNSVEEVLTTQKEVFQDVIKEMQAMSDVIAKTHEVNMREHRALSIILNNMPFELLETRKVDRDWYYPTIVDAEQTIQKIIDEKKSIARFGDGEFETIFGNFRHKFQLADEKLGNRLKEVIQSEQPNLLIGIADNYGSLDKYTDLARDGIRVYMQIEVRKKHLKILSKDRIYYDAYMSRPYILYRDNKTDAPRKRFEHLRGIWENRNVIMIEGDQTRLGVGNNLFDNCKSIRRILAPAINAYERYDEILQEALKNGEENDLFLLAVGPSAGVFAYDLTKVGFQAVDIGHVDVEYEWMLQGTGERGKIAYKYTNEIPGDEKAEEIHDPIYESQIIAKFS